MKGSMEGNVEDVMQLYKDLIRAETQIANEIKTNQSYMDGIQLKLNRGYQLGLYGYKDWLSWQRDHIHRLEGILLDVHGYKYHRQGEAKWLHSVFDARISNLYKQMHHCNNIAKEKQLLKDIRQAEEDKQKLTVNAADAMEKLKLPEHLSSVDRIQDSIEGSYARLDELKLEDRSDRAKRKDFRKELERLNKDISRLAVKLEDIRMKKQVAKKLVDLQKQRGNAAVNMKKHA